jgi:tetratricopeptide (TPR) repeat protein
VFETLGDYAVDEELARGGAGVVYRAHDPSGEPVAIKLLLGGGQSHPSALKRFQREAQVLARLDHPHVVRVREIGSEQGVPYLVMDLVSGASLQRRLDTEGPLQPRRAAELVRQVASATAHAHQLGLLHRDIKPDNVLLDEGDQTRLTDFGLVKELVPAEGSTQLSLTGQLLGTPGYWAPELAHGQLDRVGPASDVYGLGATLYALLANRPPHEGESLVDLLGKVGQPPPPLRQLRADVPPGLEAICQRCLQVLPERRYPTASALEQALTRWLEDGVVEGESGRSPAALATGLAIVGLFLAAAIVWTRRPPAPAAPHPADPPAAAVQPPSDAPTLEELIARSEALQMRFAPWEECLAPLDQALSRDPESVPALALRARTLSTMGHPDVEAALERLQAVAPSHPQLLLHEAQELDPQADLVILDHALTLTPDDLLTICSRAMTLIRLDRLDEALAAAERAVSLAPERAWPWALRSLAQPTVRAQERDMAQAIELDPEHPRVLMLRAEWLSREGRYEEALELARRAAALAPDRPGPHSRLGVTLAALKRFDEAAGCFRRALDLVERPATWAALSRSLAGSGKVDQAIEAADRALALRPDEVWFLVAKAALLSNAERWEEAEQVSRRLSTVFPEHPAALRIRGMCRAQRGELREADADLRRAVHLSVTQEGTVRELRPSALNLRRVRDGLWLRGCTDAEAALLRGVTFVEERQYAPALLCFERALELHASYLGASAGRAFCRAKLGLGSADELQTLRDSAPGAPWAAHFHALHAVESAADVQEKLRLAEDYVSRFPNRAPALRLRSVVRIDARDARGSFEDLDRAVALRDDPTHALSLAQRGIARSSSRPQQAIRDLERAIDADPTLSVASTVLANLYQLRSRHPDAIRYMMLTLELRPDFWQIYTRLAWSHLSLSNPERAANLAHASALLAPTRAEPLLVRAHALRALGRPRAARAALEKLLGLEGAARAKPKAQALLDELGRGQ